MNFNAIFLKSFRVLLLPFAILYGIIIKIRNFLYDKKYLHSADFNFPIICIGNLSVGGTGKSPMVEYLIRLMKEEFEIATLSRGYKRKTKGYVLANDTTTALEIGDEPMQFHLKFPEISVAVGEERLVAVPHLLQDNPHLQTIILDDAFQHREVKAGLNIILTDYNNLYPNDFFLPTGDLRDEKTSAKRADIIIVTKCPEELTEQQKQTLLRQLKPTSKQQVFYTTIMYALPYHITNPENRRMITGNDEILLVCGIANPKPIKELLLQQAATYYQKSYEDHHIFSIDDLNEIKEKYNNITTPDKFILTTEKDAVRLIKFSEELKELPMYVLPIKHEFLFDEGPIFNEAVLSFVRTFRKNMAS